MYYAFQVHASYNIYMYIIFYRSAVNLTKGVLLKWIEMELQLLLFVNLVEGFPVTVNTHMSNCYGV